MVFGKKKKDPITEVSKKIQNNIKRANLMKEEEIRAYAKNLSDPKSLKKAYLNKDFDAIKQMFNSLPTDNNSRTSFFTSKSEQSMSDLDGVKMPKEEDDDDFKFTSEQFDKMAESKDKIGEKVKVKLVIAEIAKTQSEVTARKLLSPLLSTFSVGGSVGFFHSALIVGPWYLEWNSSSLCIPRKCYSSAAIIAVDMSELLLSKDVKIDSYIDKLAKVICEWNSNKSYNQTSANCQHFVEDILTQLNVTPKYRSTIDNYLKQLKQKGKCEIQWDVPNDIRENCKIQQTSFKFSTHKEIDDLVTQIIDSDPDFESSPDFEFLKAFDRAFWLKYFRDPSNKDAHPSLNEDHECSCPFGDPEQSKSLLSEWW